MDFITNDKAREFVLQLGQNSPKNLADVFPNASPEGRDLLSKMLTFDPRKRITAAQALEQPYFADLYSVTKQSRGYVHSRNVNSAREVFPFRSTDRLLITRAEIEEALYTVLTDFRSWMPKSLYSSYKPSNDIAPLHPQLAGVPCQDHYLRTMRTCSATTSKSSNSSSSSSSTHHPSNLSTNGATTQSLQQQQQQQPQVAYPPHAQPPFNQNAYNPIQGTQTASGPVLQPYSIQPMAANYWSTGLCDSAADVEICTEGCCCLCCEEARIYDAVVNDQQDSLNCVVCCFGTFLHLATCLSVINLVNRRSFISKYNIQDEDMCMSACFSCLCPCLSSCQVHRELQLRGVYPGGTCCAPSRNPGPRGARVMV
eukprot:GDKK01046410.1.p1 GENE.GDKK01046410.1~~GDKK01046410.1.p1  ORF type:complete len:369 (+),score=52.25 GDKK01046410.1:80-1186(+)